MSLRIQNPMLRAERAPAPGLDIGAALGTEGWLEASEAELLAGLARGVASGSCVVEIGSYRGRSTVALALGSRAGNGVPVFAVEPHEEFVGVLGGTYGAADRVAFFQNMLRAGVVETVRLVNLMSLEAAAGWTRPIGLLWIDGDHSAEGVRRDVEAWFPHLADDAVVAFHDAADAAGAPALLVAELTSTGRFERIAAAGQTVVVRRRAA